MGTCRYREHTANGCAKNHNSRGVHAIVHGTPPKALLTIDLEADVLALTTKVIESSRHLMVGADDGDVINVG
jgi:hypothetical protein